MTDRELMQQWLDAIAAIPEDVEGYLPDALTDVLIATRERLAQPENGGKTGWPPGLLQDDDRKLSKWFASKPDARQRVREAVAQPRQEPVCFRVRCPAHSNWMFVDERQFAEYVSNGWEGSKLYTTPQPRQWVGLTDEVIWLEYQRLWPFHPTEEPKLAKDIAKFARAVEAKLREKNT